MRTFAFLLITLSLASCENVNWADLSSFGEPEATAKDTANRAYYPDDEAIVSASAQFRDGNYGRSYSQFKKALDVTPEDPQAWLGFAASADMLRRFDQSDYAYRKLKPMIGNRVEYYNNYGYSLLLRGNLQGARTQFLKAYEIDPSNERVANNLELLRNSITFPKRSPGDLKGI